MNLSWVKNRKKCSELLSYAYFGQFGMKDIVDRLKMRNILFKG